MKVHTDDLTPFVRRQPSATQILVRTVSSQFKGVRKSEPSDRSLEFNLNSNSSNHSHNNSKHQQNGDSGGGLMTIERFAEKGKFDEIIALLSHDDHESVRAWLTQEERILTDPTITTQSNIVATDPIDDHHVETNNSNNSTAEVVSSEEELSTGSTSSSTTTSSTSKIVEVTTALHVILMYRPPVEVVDLLCIKLRELKNIPVPEDYVDMNGMNPLHLSVANGCDIEVTRRLLSGSSEHLPALTMDKHGRLPLHWACTKPKRSSIFTSKKEMDNTVKNAYILIRAYAHAKVLQDHYGQTPLQIAVEHKVDERILTALHPTRKQIKATLSGILSMEDCNAMMDLHSSYRSADIPNELNWNKYDIALQDDDISSIGFNKPSNSSNRILLDEDYFFPSHYKSKTTTTTTATNNIPKKDEIQDLEDRLADCLAAFDDV